MKIQKRLNVLLTVIFILINTSCTVKFIADYDEVTDNMITDLQKNFEAFFLDLEYNLGTPEVDYENYIEFYKEIKAQARVLEQRASVIDQNEITINQIKLLEENIDLLEELHKTGITDIILIDEPRRDINTSLSSILKLELAKKRGE